MPYSDLQEPALLAIECMKSVEKSLAGQAPTIQMDATGI
jgi:hypothetical protein